MAAQKYVKVGKSEIKTSYFIRLSFSNIIYYFLKVNEAFKEIRAEAFAKRSLASSVICSLLLPQSSSINSVLIFVLPFC